jgi:ethanolamine utilization protein EutA
MSDPVTLVGLDFGTTTSSAVIAAAHLTRNAVTGRIELDQVRERYRSELVFTPLSGDRLDEAKIAAYVDTWLAAGGVGAGANVFGGGALLTGLTAQKDNAAKLVHLIRRRLGDALIATADDPCLESWLAFMGSCAGLSRTHSETPFLNLDVGGGTTNLALGRGGEVLRTGCLFVGARHVQVEPGSYRIVRVSDYARALFAHLGIVRGPGDTLTTAERDAILDYYVSLLVAAATGDTARFDEPVARLHQQVALRLPPDVADVAVTLSGGVGELVYAALRGEPWPPTTHFGDLGIDLARRLLALRPWAERLQKYRPASAGRATVYGLLRHSTAISGNTLFLPRPHGLPLADLPILGSLSVNSPASQVRDVLDLVRRSTRGGCLRIELGGDSTAGVRTLGQRLSQALRESAFPPRHPLVLLLRENLGKVLGHCVTDWGALPLNLIVLDEVAVRDAQFVHLGAPHDQVVPVSFYGLNEPGETS